MDTISPDSSRCPTNEFGVLCVHAGGEQQLGRRRARLERGGLARYNFDTCAGERYDPLECR